MGAAAATAGQVKREARRIDYTQLAKETAHDVKGDDVPGLAAEIAYHAVFAIPAIIIFMVTVAALVNQSTGVPVAERLYEFINRSAPGETRPLLNSLVENAVQRTSGGVASFGVISAAVLALWSGSNGVATLIKAFNRAYDVEETRGWVKTKALAIGLTLLLAVLVNAAFVMLVFGGRLGEWMAAQARLGETFTLLWGIAYWVLGLLFIMFVLAILYFLGPNIEQSFRWISPGSVVATILWVVVAIGFRLYLVFTDPGGAYGAVGSIVVLLFFMYLTGIAFVIGAEVNAIVGRRYDPQVVEDLANHPEKVETTQDQDEAERRAAELDRRNGTPAARPAKHLAFEAGRKADRRGQLKPASATPTPPGPSRTKRLIAGAGGLAALAVMAVMRRRTERG